MKAFIMDEERKLKISDMPDPVQKEDNLIVQIKAASYCCPLKTFSYPCRR